MSKRPQGRAAAPADQADADAPTINVAVPEDRRVVMNIDSARALAEANTRLGFDVPPDVQAIIDAADGAPAPETAPETPAAAPVENQE